MFSKLFGGFSICGRNYFVHCYSKKNAYVTKHGILRTFLMYVAIALAFGHQTNTGDMANGSALYYWLTINFLVFGLILLHRWLAPFYKFFKHRFYIDKVVAETTDVFSIYLKGKNLQNYKFLPGQFANLTFLQSAMWFTHPFSFSTAPNGQFLRFSIKTSRDFTNRINNLKPNTKVILDGPLGVFTVKQAKKLNFYCWPVGLALPLFARSPNN